MASPEPRGRRTHVGRRVAGADFDDLHDRFERDGAVEAFARLTGIWSDNQLRVEQQAAGPGPPARFVPLVTPPCPRPDGGWPHVTWGHGDKNLHFDLGDLRETGAVVALSLFRPSEDQAVLVVAAAEVDAVEARLRPQLGELLCVVRSGWTRAELDAVRGHLHARHDEWKLYILGESVGADGQARIMAKLTLMTALIAGWAVSVASGILALEPWLTPVTGSRPAA